MFRKAMLITTGIVSTIVLAGCSTINQATSSHQSSNETSKKVEATKQATPNSIAVKSSHSVTQSSTSQGINTFNIESIDSSKNTLPQPTNIPNRDPQASDIKDNSGILVNGLRIDPDTVSDNMNFVNDSAGWLAFGVGFKDGNVAQTGWSFDNPPIMNIAIMAGQTAMTKNYAVRLDSFETVIKMATLDGTGANNGRVINDFYQDYTLSGKNKISVNTVIDQRNPVEESFSNSQPSVSDSDPALGVDVKDVRIQVTTYATLVDLSTGKPVKNIAYSFDMMVPTEASGGYINS